MQSYSVLMSVYGQEKPEYLAMALESMLQQTMEPAEIVLVEDGPLTDALYRVIEEQKDRNPGLFTIIRNEANLGLGPSLAKGLLACRHELVARMDTDDLARPERCERQLTHMLEHPETAIVGGQIDEFVGDSPEHCVGRRIVPETDADIQLQMKHRCPMNHMTVMFRREAVLSAGNYRERFWNEDYDLWIRMAQAGCRFANLPCTLVDVRVGPEMYSRRGGLKYFRSEVGIQKMMLRGKMIGFPTFLLNVIKRLVVELLLPNTIRSWVFKRFARVRGEQDK